MLTPARAPRPDGQGLHTLCLLDIRVKEPSVEALCRGRKEYEPPRFMSVGVAASQLLEIEENRKEEGAHVMGTPRTPAARDPVNAHLTASAAGAPPSAAYGPDTSVVGLSRLGHGSQDIVYCSLRAMAAGPPLVDLGEPLHSLIIPGTVTEMEEQALRALARAVDESSLR